MTVLKSVMVAGIRGVPKACTLTPTKRGLLLRGDNGTGKSSLVQGLSLGLTGKLGMPIDVEVPADLIRHHRGTDDAKHVVIELAPRGRIELRGDAEPVCDAEGRAFRDACVRAAPFLRRDELLRVVTQKDTSRLRYLEGFMDLGQVERLESALRDRRLELKQSVAPLAKRLADHLDVAGRLFGAKIGSTKELVSLVTGRAMAAGLAVPRDTGWPELCAMIREARQRASTLPTQREQLVVDEKTARELTPPEAPKTALEPLRQAEKKASEAHLLELLREALEIVKAEPALDSCPVCEQAVTKRGLAKRLGARIEAMDELQGLKERAEELAEEWATFLESLSELEAAAFEEVDVVSPPESFEDLDGRELLEELGRDHHLSRKTLARLKRVRDKLGATLKSLPNERQTVGLEQLVKVIQAMGDDLGPLQRAESELARGNELLERIHKVETAIEAARKTEVAKILDGIGERVVTFYKRIHPSDAGDEPTGAPSLKVQRHGKGTARLLGLFDGKVVKDPRHVYSEGHLDTIGLAFFLALRRSRADREGARDPKLMVLDDIVGSIDAGHFDRFLDVLRDEFDDHQILFASHSGLLMTAARRALPGAAAQTIVDWSLENGPRLSGHTLPLDELREKLGTSGDPAQLARALAAPLEPFLKEACAGLAVSLPYEQSDLTVADCWDALRKKLGKLTKEGLLPDVSPEVAAVGDLDLIRNTLGAHHNPDMLADAALGPVKRVAEAFLGLVDKLSCTACRGVLRLKNRKNTAAGLGCQCPKGGPPQLSCQKDATSGVRGS